MANKSKHVTPTKCFFMLMYSPSSEPRLAEFKVGFLRGPIDLLPTEYRKPRIRPVQLVGKILRSFASLAYCQKCQWSGAGVEACNEMPSQYIPVCGVRAKGAAMVRHSQS